MAKPFLNPLDEVFDLDDREQVANQMAQACGQVQEGATRRNLQVIRTRIKMRDSEVQEFASLAQVRIGT